VYAAFGYGYITVFKTNTLAADDGVKLAGSIIQNFAEGDIVVFAGYLVAVGGYFENGGE
jgi:hypothetical protein